MKRTDLDDAEGYIALRCAMIEFAFREARGRDGDVKASLERRVLARRWIMSPKFDFWAQGLPIDCDRARRVIRAEVGEKRWEADDAAYDRDRNRRHVSYAKRHSEEAERERIGSLLAEIRMRLLRGSGNPTESAQTETQTLSSVAAS